MNKKGILFTVVIILVIIAGFFAFFLYQSKSQHILQTDSKTLSQTTKVYNEQNTKENYTVKIEYPEFSGMTDPTIEQRINTDIKNSFFAFLTTFKKQAGCVGDDCSCIPPSNNPLGENPCELMVLPGNFDETTSFEVVNSTILSVKVQEYEYMQGAHGMTMESFLNYNLVTGQKIEWESLFKKGSNYLQTIANYSRQQLSKAEIEGQPIISDQAWLQQGTDPNNKDNYTTNIGFSKDGLVVVFQQYQVAAYVYGPQTVVIPYSEFKDQLDPQSLLVN